MRLEIGFCELYLGDDNLEGVVKRFFAERKIELKEIRRDKYSSTYVSEVNTLDDLHLMLYEFDQMEESQDGYTFIFTGAEIGEGGEKSFYINFLSLLMF